jgi:hypothetical protein
MSDHINTEVGFNWGSAKIERCCSCPKSGWIDLTIITPRDEVHVYVTKTGKVRVYNKKGEMSA